MSEPPTVILVTGHPATGKTTLAHHLASNLQFPLIWKDEIKETLLDCLGNKDNVWSRKLSQTTWNLIYHQIESLLKGKTSFIVEANFDPKYADEKWQSLAKRYSFQLIQLRCETEPATLLARYIARIKSGERHMGHVDDSQNPIFLDSIKQPFGWVALNGKRISVDTNQAIALNYKKISSDLHKLIANQS